MEFKCDGIDDQGKILLEYTGYGQDISPEFIIENLLKKDEGHILQEGEIIGEFTGD